MGSDRIVYADKTNAHQSAGLVSAWILIDHQTIQEEVGDRYLSSKGQYEINCHQRTLRQIYHELFSGNMGSGGIVWSGALGRDFVPAEAGTIGRSLVNYYCS